MLTLINLLAHSYNKDSIYLLSLNADAIKFPSINLDSLEGNIEQTTDDLIRELYNKHINLDYNWAQPKLLDVDIFKNEQGIVQTHIYYSCYIPHSTPLARSYWVVGDGILPYSNILRKALLCSK
jgi:hypothetical protein